VSALEEGHQRRDGYDVSAADAEELDRESPSLASWYAFVLRQTATTDCVTVYGSGSEGFMVLDSLLPAAAHSRMSADWAD